MRPVSGPAHNRQLTFHGFCCFYGEGSASVRSLGEGRLCNVRHADAAALATIKVVIVAVQATFFAPDRGELL